MTDPSPEKKSKADEEMEREIRAGRKFTLEEAIGRLAGPGAMKGVSPVDRKRQAVLEVEEFLRKNLTDSGGVLVGVVHRQVTNSEPFLKDYEHPLRALDVCLQYALQSDHVIKELTREADIEWGRVFIERPYFEKEGCQADPDDPYTFASVREALTKLKAVLSTDLVG